MRRWLLPVAVTVLGLAAGAPAAGAPAGALEKIRFHTTNKLASAILYVGLAEGFFEAEGLDVEPVLLNNEGSELPVMAQGKIDATESGPFNSRYVNVIDRGGRIRLVAARTVHAADGCGYASFLARNELLDSGRLDELSGLAGLRVSTERSSGTYYYWSRLLEKAGLTTDDVILNEIPTEAMPEAFRKGLIDVVSATEPWVTRIAGFGYARAWLPVNRILPDRQNTFLVLGKRLLDDRRDLGRRLVAAYLRSMRHFAAEGKSDRVVAIVAGFTHLDPDELRRMCWPQLSADGRIDPAGLLDFQKWALREDLIDAIVPAERLIDDGFLPETAAAPPNQPPTGAAR